MSVCETTTPGLGGFLRRGLATRVRAVLSLLLAAAFLLPAADGRADPGGPAGAVSAEDAAAGRLPVQRQGARGILIDGIHANDLSTVGLGPEVYEYHQTTGYRRLFEYLRSRGVSCDRVTEGRLDSERLSRYRLLFMNLASSERPPLLVSEIAAIRSFVVQGGSLLVITDHSNCYFHAHRLQPLFAELDIRSHTDTACDEPPHTLGNGKGWIAVTRFKPHPVTADLKCLGLQTGGCVDPRFAVAMTGERSWADAWSAGMYGEENAPGFLGNFRRDPGEPAGPLGVVMAKSLKRGRIVVIGDQNMLGESFVNYADNYRLWLGAVAWLLGEERLREAKPYHEWRSPRIRLYERYERAAFGSPDPDGCYHAWVLLNRFYWAFAGDRLSEPCDLMVFAYNDCELPAEAVAAVSAHLRRGKNALVLNAESHTLWEEPGVVGQVLKGMGVARPSRHAADGKLIIELPAAGAIHVLGPDTVLDNGILPPPTRVPTAAEKERNRQLLDAVRDALTGKPLDSDGHGLRLPQPQ